MGLEVFLLPWMILQLSRQIQAREVTISHVGDTHHIHKASWDYQWDRALSDIARESEIISELV